jgi:serine/threonine protein kinase
MDSPFTTPERDRLLAELARRDAGQPPKSLGGDDESTLATLKGDLETLAAELQEPPPIDDFAEESGCQRAIDLVERIGCGQIGRGAEFSQSGSSQFFPPGSEGDDAVEAIGPYRVVARLGRGGMGAVYKAVHPKLKRDVAVKVLPTWRLRDPAAVARFEREMEAVGALDHPNIVAAHDAGEADGMHYLVMEFVDGLDLSAVVRRIGPLPIPDACEIIRQAALGLQAAADRGMVHRDVKPSNLMLAEAAPGRRGATVKILDFGLARLASLPQSADEADGDDLTATGLVMGTLRYMAPEQCARSSAVDVRADVYSLGATLYKLLCGASPFAEERFDSPLALLAALACEEPPRLASRRPEVPPPLAALVHRMLDKDPAERPTTPGDVAAALENWTPRADLDALLGRARAGTSDSQPSAAVRREAPRTETSTARKGSGPWRSVLIGVGAMAVVAMAVAMLSPPSNTPQRADTDASAAPPAAAPPAVEAPTPDEQPATSASSVVQMQDLPADHPSFAQSRRTAEWMLARRMRFGVLTDGGEYVDMREGGTLPEQPLQVEFVDLSQELLLTDAELEQFQDLPFISLLNVSLTKIGDEGLLSLGRMPRLAHLFLVGTSVTDEGLDALSGFPELATLFVKDTGVTDAGLDRLVELPRLKEVMLVNCPITDAGLAKLHQVASLKTLYINGTQVTARGIIALQDALPDCRVESDFPSDALAAARHNPE